MSVTLVQVTPAAARPGSPFLWGADDLPPIPVSAAIATGLDWPAHGQLIAWADQGALVVAPATRVAGGPGDDRASYAVGPLLVQQDTVPRCPSRGRCWTPSAGIRVTGCPPGSRTAG